MATDAAEEEVREPLSDMAKMALRANPITTLTFQTVPAGQGQGRAVERTLRQRLAAMVAASPWLAGHIDAERAELVYRPTPPAPADIHHRMFHASGEEEPSIDRSASLDEMTPALRPHLASTLGMGDSCVKLAWLATQESGRFVLVFSVSHVLADGSTYYSLLDMLSGASPVRALAAPTNDPAVFARIAEAYSNKVTGIFAQKAFLLNLLLGKMRGWLVNKRAQPKSWLASVPFLRLPPEQRSTIRYSYVSETYVAEKKAEAEGEVPWVSTNDVLSSWFMKAFDASLMAINFRNRIEGCHENMAGNFEGLISFVGEADAGRPALVRKALLGNRFRRVSDPADPLGDAELVELPEGPGVLGKGLSICSNWATFQKQPSKLPGRAELHIPFRDADRGGTFMRNNLHRHICIIFRANERLAVALIGFPAVLDRLDGSALAEPLDVRAH